MHGCEDAPAKAAPMLGEDTENILKNMLHMSDEKIASLRENGVV